MSNSTDANTTGLVNVTDGSKDLRTSSLNDGQKAMSLDFPLEDDFDKNVPIYIISMVIGGLLIITIVSTIIFRYKRRRRSDPDHAPIFIPGKPSVKSVTITERAQLAEYQYESNPIFADNLVDKMTCLIENDSMEHRMVLEYESIKSIMPRVSSLKYLLPPISTGLFGDLFFPFNPMPSGCKQTLSGKFPTIYLSWLKGAYLS